MANQRQFGLLGKDIEYSFSRSYFAQKFKNQNLQHCSYQNFDLSDPADIPQLLADKSVSGINVTIPYKQTVIPHLDALDEIAETIGAVNTIHWQDNQLWGYNTDAIGFEKALKEAWQRPHAKALILGTGGASKAVAYVLKKNDIDFRWVSRKSENKDILTYKDLDENTVGDYTLIVNTTPLGTFPKTELRPNIPYGALTTRHCLFDLVYNPEVTSFMQEGLARGATVSNGYKMLVYQAEASWKIWNS